MKQHNLTASFLDRRKDTTKEVFMKVQANTLRRGHAIEHEGKQFVVVNFELILPGKGNAFISVEMRNARTGIKTNERFRTQETVEKLMTDERVCTVLFTEGNQINLMDSETFEQFFVDIGILGGTKKFLTDGMEVTVDTVEAIPVGVRLPQQVTLEVIEADAVIKGQTASSSYKPAILANGFKTMVPPHIEKGTRVVVATSDGSYVERAKD